MDGAFAAMPRQARVFESSLHTTACKTASFDYLVRDKLNQIVRDFHSMGTDSPSMPPAPGPLLSEASATLLRELGDYFTRTAQMWSTMTHNLLQGPHIDQISRDVNVRSATETRLADLSTIAAVDVELGRLRKIRDLTAKFSKDVQAVWRPEESVPDPSSSSQAERGGQFPLAATTLSSPSQDARFIPSSHTDGDSFNTLAGGMAEQMDLGKEDDSDSDSGDEELFSSINMDALKQRGKGTYMCPKGTKCDKGGVDRDGKVIIFDRNSSFAYVPKFHLGFRKGQARWPSRMT
ncbi:hypothetical protein ISF_02475 [Cordyceps fumosorosea ARSEF 2679]|uniref:Uncharacterized protein n=1 Tax=Cordyceps fumosorosea (strain ARSEF 2679) TaxID=1081104 RepID=A0A168BSR9_CORFA|nr:hypothetical protein ISF_02475 [Cordyceps fumosorosea ARSEF 2679]OAA70501.1 hypothetical protein ISF_02475 [Cordyceps fumosorosea ARSEF 2679]